MKKNYFFLLLCVFSFLTISGQTNLVPNGNMESWDTSDSNPTEWFRFSNGKWKKSSDAQNKTASLELEVTTGQTQNFIFSPNIPFVKDTKYIGTFYYKLVSGTFNKVNFNLVHKPGSFPENLSTKEFTNFPTDKWTKGEFEFTATTSENIQVYIKTYGNVGSKILIDNVSVLDKKSTEIVNITDINFKSYLISNNEININKDNEIQLSEAESFKGYINLYAKNKPDNEKVSDLTGIEAFINLTRLSCNYNLIKTFDISKNTKLESFYCDYNLLTNIDISKNINLKYFSCAYNQLTSIDITNNLALLSLNCFNNKLKNIDTSLNKSLENLGCHYNQITDIDVSKNNLLEGLTCSNNLLTELNLTQNEKLKSLYFSENSISTIDLSKNLNLENLSCQSNKLTTLDVSNNSKLLWIWCKGNQINNLDLTKNINLTDLRCYNNKISNLTLGDNTKLTYIDCDNNLISSLDVSNSNALVKLSCEKNKITSLSLSNNIKLTNLDCNKNLLKSLNVSKNTELTDLNCSENSIDVLDLNKNLSLKTVYCGDNNIKSLNTSQNKNLISFFSENNQITSLDFSKNYSIEQISCRNNKLVSLNVQNTNNKNITFFFSDKNPNLSCIQVDDENVAPTLNFWKKDSTAEYSENCGATASIDKLFTNQLNIYPNPVINSLKITTQNNQIIKNISIFNTLGKKVLQTSKLNINTTSLNQGLYLIKIESTDNKIALKKFIKQ
ncbi:T9SS type A sorting domain-containing protein [Tenacibaculum halocynthiae]|uniref:T9SS type A sorting domain-containing protein n=1 Tax=Tenacibaculum halocynthiae TaxID=1254437 RepID=UPI0038951279